MTLDFPISRCRKIFSNTTMELSTTMPMAKLRPARLTTLMFLPIRVMTRNVPTTLIGMDIATMTVLEKFLRKTRSTTTARVLPR